VRLSLARTAKLLIDQQRDVVEAELAAETEADWSAATEDTDWGKARRVRPPVEIDGAPMQWAHPARRLGSADPRWF